MAASMLAGAGSAYAQSSATYTYDALGRVVTTGTPSGSTTYTYDAADNRSRVQSSLNGAPTAANDSATVQPGASVTIPVLSNDTDPNGDTPLTLIQVGTPAKGTASISGTNVLYTAGSGQSGTDSFAYSIRDSRGAPASGTVTVTIAAANRNPTAGNDSVSTAYQTQVSFNPLGNDSDPDGDTVSVTSVSTPSSGTTSRSGNTITFTPASGFSGNASFTYTIGDGRGGSATGTVTVSVAAPINRNPTAGADSVSTAYQTPVSFNPLGNDSDPDGDTVSVTSVSAPTSGSTSRSGNTITYTPASGFSGNATFSYSIGDGRGGAATGNVTVSVQPRPQNNPVAGPDAVSTAYQTPVTFNPLGNDYDPDGDPFSIGGVTQGQHGSVSFTGSSLTYTPAAGYSGSDYFHYAIYDNRGGGGSNVVNVTVGAPPVPTTVARPDTMVLTSTLVVPEYGIYMWLGCVNVLANDSGANLQVTGISKGDLTGSTVCYSTYTVDTAPINYSISGTAGPGYSTIALVYQ